MESLFMREHDLKTQKIQLKWLKKLLILFLKK